MYEKRFRKWGLSKNHKKDYKKRVIHSRLGKRQTADTRLEFSDENDAENSTSAQHPRHGCFSVANRGDISFSVPHCSEYTKLDHSSAINLCDSDYISSSCDIVSTSSELGPSHVMPLEQSGLSEDSSYSMIEHHSETWSNTRSSSPTESQHGDLPPFILFNSGKPEAFGGVNLESILKSVKSYLSHLDSVKINPTGPSNELNLVNGNYFWDQLSHGIYLFKVSSNKLAWKALRNACGRASTAIQWEDARGIGKLLTTLSPVNTAVCPELRQKLLEFIHGMAKYKLGSSHPFTTICQQLSHDQKPREVSERVLRFMLDLLICRQGSSADTTIQTQRMLIKSLRRSKDYDGSLRLANELISMSIQCWGDGHLETQRARREVEHVLMDMGEWDQALEVCRSIIHANNNRPWTNTRLVDDECIVSTMEDLAKIYEHKGDLNLSIEWLLRAATSELTTATGGVAAAHIAEKLLSALRRVGREDEATFWEDHFRESRRL